MAKTELTKTIEKELFKYFQAKSMRCGLEIDCPKLNNGYWFWLGICDFVAYNHDEFTFIEIKISLSDFKSKNGHNLVGHKNYYCVPSELVEKVLPLIPKHIGLYSWDGENLINVKRCRKTKEPLFMNGIKNYDIGQIEQLKDNMMKACGNVLVKCFGGC